MTCSSTLKVRAAIFEDGSATYILWFFKTRENMKDGDGGVFFITCYSAEENPYVQWLAFLCAGIQTRTCRQSIVTRPLRSIALVGAVDTRGVMQGLNLQLRPHLPIHQV